MIPSEVSEKRSYANYHVALKILLKRGDDYLFLTDAFDGFFDFPGGRIDDVEHLTSLPDIIAREVREELGENVRYTLGKPIFQYRRHRESKNWHVFVTVYEADYISGEITLSAEHSDFQWIHKINTNLQESSFFNEEEYLAFKKYFKSLG